MPPCQEKIPRFRRIFCIFIGIWPIAVVGAIMDRPRLQPLTKTVFFPTAGISINVVPDIQIIRFITDYMVIKALLPKGKTNRFGCCAFHHPNHR